MADDGVADLDAPNILSHLLHPTRVFMSEYVRKLDVDLFAPKSLNDMQVSPTDTGSTNSYDDVSRFFDFRIGNAFVAQEITSTKCRIVFVKHSSFHSDLLPGFRDPISPDND